MINCQWLVGRLIHPYQLSIHHSLLERSQPQRAQIRPIPPGALARSTPARQDVLFHHDPPPIVPIVEPVEHGGKVDAALPEFTKDTVADGFEVAAIVENLTEDLRAFPVQAAETMERLRAKVVFPAADLEPAEFVIADQRLLQATMKVDAIYGSLITYVEIADTLDLDGSAERDYLIDVLENSAANRSVFLQVALVDVDVLRAAAASLPDDASVPHSRRPSKPALRSLQEHFSR